MKQIYTILAVLALVALAFLTGRCSAEEHIAPSPVVTKTDTVSIRDTVTVDRPVYVDRLVTDTMLVSISDTVTLRDTAYIVIEREQKHYRSDDYEAWVSGYRPALDSIIVFPETKYIKETMTDNRKSMLYLSGEVLYSDRFTTAAMLTYQRKWRYFQLEAGAGYDLVGNNAVVMARLKIPLYRW